MKQHSIPCSDCPWRRNAMKGWLGSEQTPEDWVRTAMGEVSVECHTHGNCQCAGISIFRANVCKSPRYKEILVLKPNRESVFSTPKEFIDYHRTNGKTSAEH